MAADTAVPHSDMPNVKGASAMPMPPDAEAPDDCWTYLRISASRTGVDQPLTDSLYSSKSNGMIEEVTRSDQEELS